MSDVVIVDDAEIGSLGWVRAVEELGHRVQAMDWSTASRRSVDLAGSDLVVLLVRRDPRSWDRYGALGHGLDLRSEAGQPRRTVAVLDPHEMTNAMVRLRLAGLGVDEVIATHRLQSRVAASDLIEGRLTGAGPQPSAVELAARRVGRRSDPNRVIGHLLALPKEPDYLRAFDPDLRQNQCGLSRRQALTLRRKVSEIGDLAPDASNGGGPVRNSLLPRWSDMVSFVNECRGWDPDDEFRGLIDRRGQAGSSTSTADLDLTG